MAEKLYTKIPRCDKKVSKPTQEKTGITTEKLDSAQIKKIFNLFDYNGNGCLSLAEIDRAIIDLYPHIANNHTAKTTIIKEAQKIAKSSKNGFIGLKEFEYFIRYLHDYCEKVVITTKKLSKAQVKEAFETVDYNNNGIIPLTEVDKAVVILYPHFKKNKSTIIQAYEDKVPKFSQEGFISFKEFEYLIDALHYYNEKAVITTKRLSRNQIKKIFDIFDNNNDGIISKDEISEAVIRLYPHLSNDESVIVQAYKAADTSQDGLIDLNEFGRLIDLLHYYDELSRIFKKLDTDNDERIDFKEFKKGCELIGINVKSNTILKTKFDEICANNEEYINFDNFCVYAAKIKLISETPQDNHKKGTWETWETWGTQEIQEIRETRETQKTQPIKSQTTVNLSSSSSQWKTFAYFCLSLTVIFMGIRLTSFS
ncbi:hypothetical protein RclHR1_06220008 [Rhizophagus clarus]|uniref:EF-hand domain-containing protein n=1 Tax=Rhizophagus clarus TaxID=94130 RepID=A0A2Z6S3I5_9GLOM|nr:hypothetical protein RclHR1_06220008 [Rhizophagus clarus]GES79316.1 hypothetical protein RCL_jg6321.t1 [Rhizophagus clarus]